MAPGPISRPTQAISDAMSDWASGFATVRLSEPLDELLAQA